MWEITDAVGSFGGMVLAGIAGYVAYRLFKVESARDLRAEVALRRQQASAIGFWREEKGLVVSNLSTLPIYGIRVSVQYPDDLDDRQHMWVINDDKKFTTPLNYFGARGQEVLRPGETHMIDFPLLADMSWAEDPYTMYPGFKIRFRDNAGNGWRRFEDGTIEDDDL